MHKRKNRFVSTKELGVLLGVTRQTVRNWTIKGDIKAYKIGQSIKIPKAEAIRILRKFEQPIPTWLDSEDRDG